MPTTVVHVNDCDLTAPDVVYIGREVPRRRIVGGKWGNPYPITPNAKGDERKRVLLAYLDHLLKPRASTQRMLMHGDLLRLVEEVPEIRGKRLACWCKGKKDPRCHGDILAALADGATVDQVRAMLEAGECEVSALRAASPPPGEG